MPHDSARKATKWALIAFFSAPFIVGALTPTKPLTLAEDCAQEWHFFNRAIEANRMRLAMGEPARPFPAVSMRRLSNECAPFGPSK